MPKLRRGSNRRCEVGGAESDESVSRYLTLEIDAGNGILQL
ncbi:hypothetical protein ABFB09_05485 [Dehalogenimonas sp. THU2]